MKRCGLVLASAKGGIPVLAEKVAGGPIKGSWWAHKAGQEIFMALGELGDDPDVLFCRLVRGKVTLVHRVLWAPLAALATTFPAGALDRVIQEHTATGAHRNAEIEIRAFKAGRALLDGTA